METGNLCCGIYDYDGVLVPGEELMDEQIIANCGPHKEAIEATNIYAEKLFRRQLELIQEKQELELERDVYDHRMREIIKELKDLEEKIKRHFIIKDQVLEETEKKYENLIDYDKIYTLENVYPGVLELLWEIYEKGIYKKLFNNTHTNKLREETPKKILLRDEFPPMTFVPVRFHIMPYRDHEGINLNRKPTDKVQRMLVNNTEINPYLSSYVDNSKSVIKCAKVLGFRPYFVDKEQDPCELILRAANETIDLVHGDKIKKLSR